MLRFHAFVLFLVACTSSPSPSGASCPSAQAPTYQSFGRQFFATYCIGCHSRSAPDRHGAPGSLSFDTESDIRAHAVAIDAEAAAGPAADNTDMPDTSGPVRAAPTLPERRTLGEFLACEQELR